MTKKKNSRIPPDGMKSESASLPSITTTKPKMNRLPNTKRLFWPRGRPSWSCPPNWFRRSSSSSARNGPHRTMMAPRHHAGFHNEYVA